MKFGGEILQVQYNRYEAPSAAGNFQFTNGFTTRTANNDGTGDALASMFLALPAVSNRSVGPSRIDGRQWIYSAYIQDDFRILPNLTLNLGLRYELAPPVYDVRQQMSSIDYSNVPSPQSIFASGKTGLLCSAVVRLRPGRYAQRLCAHGLQQLCAARSALSGRRIAEDRDSRRRRRVLCRERSQPAIPSGGRPARQPDPDPDQQQLRPAVPWVRHLRTGGGGSLADSAGRYRHQSADQLFPAMDASRCSANCPQAWRSKRATWPASD